MSKAIQHRTFIYRHRYEKIIGLFRNFKFRLYGMQIGKGTYLPKVYVEWPNQVLIGDNCKLQHNVFFNYDGVWSKGPSIRIGDNVFIGSGTEFNIQIDLSIGSDCLIASGCRFVDHDHGIETDQLMRVQWCSGKKITIENDVWIGANVVVLKGVTIQKGAIVAAGAVVTKSISTNEIWGGVPAKKIGERK